MTVLALFALLAASAIAMPATIQRRQALQQGYTAIMPIHSSCNATERAALTAALADLNNLTITARDYIASRGAQDPLYTKWFGNGDYISVIGSYQAILSSNKANMTLRCDNPDGNCQNAGWAGHWRGSNATSETVICPLSYQIREPLSEVCDHNYTVSGSSVSYYFATDLMHRFYHLPGIADGEVNHYADSYAECLDLAINNATWAPANTQSLAYAAIDIYARTIARPGVGCTGVEPKRNTTAISPSTQLTTTASAASACHTHADGFVHC